MVAGEAVTTVVAGITAMGKSKVSFLMYSQEEQKLH